MKNLKYKIQFYSEWQCGSGLAAGADVDALAIKDKEGLPFVPGKTMKGLVREALETIYDMRGEDKSSFIKLFGNSKDKSNIEKETAKVSFMEKGETFFTNASLDSDTYSKIKENHAAKYLYKSIASTSIEDNGIAERHSLRKIETVIPLTLHGEIKRIPDGLDNEVEKALHFIKRIGFNRNRGLGRCNIEKEA